MEEWDRENLREENISPVASQETQEKEPCVGSKSGIKRDTLNETDSEDENGGDN